MGLLSKAQQAALLALLVVIAGLIAFGGWNWWRKNVYYDALQTVAQQRAENTRKAQDDLNAKLNEQALDLFTRSNERERQLKAQIDEIATRAPGERVVYKLRDRWLPSTCPAGATPGAAPVTIDGLQREDELFLVRLAAAADRNTDERNTCASMYETARQAAIKANK